MRKIKLYIAMSLNGKIAQKDGSVDWLESLPNPDKLDYGYTALIESVDTTLQGYTTYASIADRGIEVPTKDKTNYVLTNKKEIEDKPFIHFVTADHLNFIKNLKQQPGKDIWLIGGGQTNTWLFNEGLIDEMQVFVIPMVLTDGIELFELLPKESTLQLQEVISYSSGIVELRYRL